MLRAGTAGGLKLIAKEGETGVIALFEEFYLRLFERSEAFRGYFSGDVRKRGAVILRILEQLTSLNLKTLPFLEKRFKELGMLHVGMNIRPWMYSVFIETLVISYCLY